MLLMVCSELNMCISENGNMEVICLMWSGGVVWSFVLVFFLCIKSYVWLYFMVGMMLDWFVVVFDGFMFLEMGS